MFDRGGRRGVILLVGLVTGVLVPGALSPQAAGVTPEGFTDVRVLSVAAPTALAWTPDGRMLVTGKAGRLTVVRNGERSVALDITGRVCDQGERGLLGIAVDPRFERNRFVYLFYTRKQRGSCGESGGPAPRSRVGRFVLRDDDVIRRRSETVIVDGLVSPQPNHLGGDLEFGADGFLYISVGDGVCSLSRPSRCGPLNENAGSLRNPLGKILRVNRHGVPPADNPYAGAPGARRCTRPTGVPPGAGPCKEIFAHGLRNPFRFARKPGTSTFWIGDVGLNTWEEVDRLRKGAHYGWNLREGRCRRDSATDCTPVPRFTDPIYDYRHGECRSITGSAFVPRGLWPGFNRSFLHADFGCGKVFKLTRDRTGRLQRSTFLTGLRGPVHLRFGPYQDTSALYYLSFFGNEVRRVALTDENALPVADFSYRPDGRDVTLNGASSTDPENEPLARWHWDFGDGATAETDGPRVSHTYATTGPFEVTLTVTDASGLESPPRTRTVHSGEHAPELRIATPAPAARFRVGEVAELSAVAVDQEDGTLPGSAMSWTIRRRHANHTHPHLGPVPGGSVTTRYPAPEELGATRNSWLVARVTATDSRGLTTKAKQFLLPKKVRLTFDADPRGAEVVVQGARRPTPFTVVSWARYVFPVAAPDQRVRGTDYVFGRWSDGGPRQHDITTPRRAETYVAHFRQE